MKSISFICITLILGCLFLTKLCQAWVLGRQARLSQRSRRPPCRVGESENNDNDLLDFQEKASTETTEKRLPINTPPIQTKSVPQRSPTASELMTAMGTSPRRIFLSSLSAIAIALAGNLFGVTSKLLMAFPEDQVAATGLDTYFPRGPYKRFRTADYCLVIPKEWVADTAVELAKAQRRSMSLDYSMRAKSNAVLPDAAFGPPGNLLNKEGTAGDTNVSVIKTAAPAQFDLRSIMTEKGSDDPTTGAQFLLQKFLAGPGREVTLLSVSSDQDVPDTTGASYRFRYRVIRNGRPPLQAVSVIAQKYATSESGGNVLFTFTVVAPDATWQTDFATKLQKVADSFHLV